MRYGAYARSVHDPGRYGRSFADVYDRWYGDLDPIDDIVATIGVLAPGTELLELGVGSGRLATPLAAAGFNVTGIDASEPMLRLLTNPAAGNAHTGCRSVLGNMAVLPFAQDSFDVIVIAYNTLFNLTTVEGQDRCLFETARCLKPGGRLVVDAFVPADPPETRQQVVTRARATDDELVLIATRQNGRSHLVEGAHLQFTASGMTARPWAILSCGPDELDERAEAVGLCLVARRSTWRGDDFHSDSSRHISVYEPDG